MSRFTSQWEMQLKKEEDEVKEGTRFQRGDRVIILQGHRDNYLAPYTGTVIADHGYNKALVRLDQGGTTFHVPRFD